MAFAVLQRTQRRQEGDHRADPAPSEWACQSRQINVYHGAQWRWKDHNGAMLRTIAS